MQRPTVYSNRSPRIHAQNQRYDLAAMEIAWHLGLMGLTTIKIYDHTFVAKSELSSGLGRTLILKKSG